MQSCPECDSECRDGAFVCPDCGATLRPPSSGPSDPLGGADYDPETEAERFERRYGVDLGDRTVGEFLEYVDRQDYSPTAWFYLLVGAEVVGVALFAYAVFVEWPFGLVFAGVSGVLALAVLGDTRAVGQFDPWAKIRLAYVLLAAVPLVGHVAAFLYLVLRRLMRERTARHRRILHEAGGDVETGER